MLTAILDALKQFLQELVSSPESKSGFLGELFNNLMPLAAARGYPFLVLSVHTSNVAVVLAHHV